MDRLQNRIYHYTSLDSLALILRTRNLRFTRLDCVDDVREAQRHIGIDFGKYFFVSCWTQEETESIPQWNMYSREMQGVRLELPEHPFANAPLRPPARWSGIGWEGDIDSPLSFEALWGPSYFVVPLFFKRDFFAGPVLYVASVEAVYARSIRREVLPSGAVTVKIDALPMLPRHKSQEWRFQREYRFSLFILPSLSMPPEGPGAEAFSERIGQHLSQSLIDNVDPGIKYFDVPLDPSALRDLVVRIGPLCTAGSQACVEALISRFAPDARIELSALAGSIRPRGH